MARSFWVASVTQGGADAFAQSSFSTALSGLTNQAALVREILIEIPQPANITAAGNTEVCITRRTKAAMPLITDDDVVIKQKAFNNFTTSGAIFGYAVTRYIYSEDDDLKLIEDPLYLQIDSNATTLTQTAYVRIAYELVRITTDERIALLTLAIN